MFGGGLRLRKIYPHMRRRFIGIAISVLAAGVATVLFFSWQAEHDSISAPPPTDNELFDLAMQRHGDLAGQTASVSVTPIEATQSIRLAIGSFGLSDDSKNRELADLVVARLAGTKGVELVERQSLSAALKETELNLSELVRAADAVRIGKLLRADWVLLGNVLTNSIVIRIVDGRTGVIRDAGVVAGESPLTSASAIAEFVRQSREAATRATRRVFLAIGGFGDVGINNRQANVPSQLHNYLIAAYRNSTTTLLERQHVDVLLQEVRLDLAGLTEGNKTDPLPSFQSAFWLVDGFFQSFETSGFEVELAVRINRIFGRTTLHHFRGTPGEPLYREIRETIDATLAKQSPSLLIPTRRSEIAAQMQLGKELLQIAMPNEDPVSFPTITIHSSREGIDANRRKRNLEEAVKAFRTVLLLDPDSAEAKFYLGMCLHDWALPQIEEARGYLQEAAAQTNTANWATKACYALASSYRHENKHEESKWFRKAAQLGNPHYEDIADRQLAQALAADSIKTGIVNAKAVEIGERLLVDSIQSAENVLKGKSGVISDDFGLGHFVELFGTNKQAAGERIGQLLPSLNTKFPDLAPHLLAAAVTIQVTTNSPIITEFRKSLAEVGEWPDTVLNCRHYFVSLTRSTYAWCMEKQAHALAVELMETKRRAAARQRDLPFDARDNVRLGFAYVKLERWNDALAAFEAAGDSAITMQSDGPWGRAFDSFLPGKAATECRTKLGLLATQKADRFEFEKPCFCLHSESSFSISENTLWIASAATLFNLDFDLKTNIQVALPMVDTVPVTTVCAGSNRVWIGTQGSGLIEYDKITRRTRRMAEQDGLLLNDISDLYLHNDVLWIGFGRGSAGGLGKLDLKSGRLSAFTPALQSDFLDKTDPLDGPPRHAVSSIGLNQRDEVCMKVAETAGIRRYRTDGSWDTISQAPGFHVSCFTIDSHRLIAGLNVMQTRIKHVAGDIIPKRGALGIRSFRDNEWKIIVDDGSLPAPPKTLIVSDFDVWLGGEGYIAVVDTVQRKVRKSSSVSARSVDRIEIGGGFVWAQFDKHLHRCALTETD